MIRWLLLLAPVMLIAVYALWTAPVLFRRGPSARTDQEVADPFCQSSPRARIWPTRVLEPDAECPMYLTSPTEEAGLGHSFWSFNGVIELAIKNNLTLRTHFPDIRSHGLNSTAAIKYFFGDYFFPRISTPTVLNINVHDHIDLDRAIRRYRGVCNISTSAIFQLDVAPQPTRAEGANICGYRKAFSANAQQRGPRLKKMSFVIAVHMRRGDVAGKIYHAGRWVSNKAYMEVISQVIRTIQCEIHCRIEILLYAEGAVTPYNVPDIDGRFTDFQAVMQPVNVTIGASDTLDAVSVMCDADVLITGMSGFSHLVNVLCVVPVVVAFPMWVPYWFVPNVVTVVPIKRRTLFAQNTSVEYVDGASFNNTEFQAAWHSHKSMACKLHLR